jgi:hypothetical protein
MSAFVCFEECPIGDGRKEVDVTTQADSRCFAGEGRKEEAAAAGENSGRGCLRASTQPVRPPPLEHPSRDLVGEGERRRQPAHEHAPGEDVVARPRNREATLTSHKPKGDLKL